MLGVFIILLYMYAMPIKHEIQIFAQSEARNLPTWGYKSMMEGPTIMLGVFIILLYMYTMPNKHYSSKPTSLRYHLMAKHCLKVGRKSKSEARNLPTWGCKSMMEGPTIMLGVFIILLYMYSMPNLLACN